MKNYFPIFILLFGAIFLSSCDAKRTEDGDLLFGLDPSDGTSNNSSRLLKKMTSHSLDDETGEWEDSEITFNYVNSKLVSFDNGLGENINIEYSNTKISKLVSSGLNATFEYSGGNLSQIVSEIPDFFRTTSTFTYSGSKIQKVVAINEFLNSTVPIKLYLETDYEYTGENIMKGTIKNGAYDQDGNLQMMDEVQIMTFTYDDKKNPYKLLPNELVIYLAGIAPNGASYLSSNNFLKYLIEINGVQGDAATFTYTYDAENYPIKAVSPDNETMTYEYQ